MLISTIYDLIMTNIIITNDIYSIFKRKLAYASLIFLIGIGFLSGFKFNSSLGEGIAVNAPYNIGFMLGILSLAIIFIATVLAFVLLFREQDANFSLIVYTTPIEKKKFALSRFLSFCLLTLFSFLVLVSGFVIGLNVQPEAEMISGFKPWHFIYPFLLFGIFNTLFICGLLFLIAQKFKNKLLVAISGIFLYIMYILIMVFSNAPFMAQALPQSLLAQEISALADPFGLSSYFFESKDQTLLQRNTQTVPFSNHLLLNRILFFVFALTMIYGGVRSFSFQSTKKRKYRKPKPSTVHYSSSSFIKVKPVFNVKSKWQSIISFITIDCMYLFKGVALIAVSILLLFYVGMEMYSDIDKGIRLPQHYASSGLLVQTINGSFYFIAAFALIYFVNDLYWRSRTADFSIIQDTTYYAKEKLIGHIGSIVILIFYFTILLVLEAIVFQFVYDFPFIDWKAYWGVAIFNTFPLLLFSGLLLFINHITRNKNLALGISIICFLLLVSPLSKVVISNSLLRFLSGYNGVYSDFNGYGIYLTFFVLRLTFGFSIIGILFLLYSALKHPSKRLLKGIGLSILIGLSIITSLSYLKGYSATDKDTIVNEMIHYEKNYRKYQNIVQPTIKKVHTKIDLHPEKRSYTIKGSYQIVNLNSLPIDSILLNIPKELEIRSLTYFHKNKTITINTPITELILQQSIQPKDSAKLEFELSYKWHAVNGHNPFNAIISNGSFMRISRYFPYFGYDKSQEISDTNSRKKHGLGKVTRIKPLEATRKPKDDFIHLDMLISTPNNQIAVGTGELIKNWQEKGRNYFSYKAQDIPFRFALSSAQYQLKSVMHNNVTIQVYYNPLHYKNVDYLIKNTQLTLDYCIEKFGIYPFKSVTFAEVSSFTKGFAGTAYPGVIFMTEDMTFNANIAADNKQDVVNELAGHEVSHFWWGTNQINPDYREGYAMLTESLAMYTEMMLYKKIHGKEKMMERVTLHKQIYDAEKGFYENVPLIKASKEQPHVAYSKGAIVFVEISELIGEDQLNLALKNFLKKYKYPNSKPIATDLVKEILDVSNIKHHKKIKALLEGN